MVRTVLIVLCLAGLAWAEPVVQEPKSIVSQYVAASKAQQGRRPAVSMFVDIAAKVPKLGKYGHLRALRHVSSLGRITYQALSFEGDRAVKNNVIARYLSAEVQSAASSDSTAITPDNYKFKFKGRQEAGERGVYCFLVTPRKKAPGMFRGELWVDSETYLPVRESGRLVKNPSILLRKVEFVREYAIKDGMSVPHRMESVVETRLVGSAQLTVDYSDVSVTDDSAVAASDSLL